MVPRISICFTDLTHFSFTKSFVSALEGAGIYAVFLPENSHVPIQRPKTLKSFPDIKRLAGFYDPFPCLSALAALTDELKLGTSVCLLTQRDVLLVARALETIQEISGGRFIFGVAGGFIREAMENHGSIFQDRWKIVENSLLKLRQDWNIGSNSKKKLSFPPVWIGSNSKKVPARVARYADGWLARKTLYPGNAIIDMKNACEEIGRDYSKITMTSMDASLELDELIGDFEAGYQHFIYFVSTQSLIEMSERLDSIFKLIDDSRRYFR